MTAPSPVRVLLAHIIDYAGTFPPASLAVEDAVAAYARELAASDAWLMGRLVIGVQHLDAVCSSTKVEPYRYPVATSVNPHATSVNPHATPVNPRATSVGLDLSRATPGEWQLSVIAGPDARAALAQVDAFNARWAARARVASVEFSPAADIAGLSRLTGDRVEAFFETPIDADLQARLDDVAAAGAAAKVRTGGTTPSAIPTPRALAHFLDECAQRHLPFKATAGLHHAVRSCYPLTYERDSSTAVMHGFLNVVAAASLAAAGARRTDIEDILGEPSARVLMDTACRYDAAATRQFFRSFGSCSFREPADELIRLLGPT